jgi:hypothetical protein
MTFPRACTITLIVALLPAAAAAQGSRLPPDVGGPLDPIFGRAIMPTFQVIGIEATQAVIKASVPADPGNTLPLIAGKPTAVRVYLNLVVAPNIFNELAQGTRGSLRVSKAPTTPGGSPTVRLFPAVNPKDVWGWARQPDLVRIRDGSSIDFLLPADIASAGETLTVSFEDPYTLTSAAAVDAYYPWPACDGNEFPCVQRENADGIESWSWRWRCVNCGGRSSTNLTFTPPVDLRLRLIGITYPGNSGTTLRPALIDYQLLESWLLRAYPVSNILMTQTDMAAPTGFENWGNEDPRGCNAINSLLAATRAIDISNGTDRRTHYYGMVMYLGPTDDSGSLFMRGCAAEVPGDTPEPAVVASGPTGPTGKGWYAWKSDGSWGDFYGAHEIAHTLGRFHADSGCGDIGGDGNYPYPDGRISPATHTVTGFDVGDESHQIRMQPLPGDIWKDVMSYCDNIWISDYTYTGLLARLRAEMALPASAPAAGPAEGNAAAAPDIFVFGYANLTQGSGAILAVRSLTSESSPSTPGDPAVTLRALDASGAILATRPAGFHPNSESGTIVSGSFVGSFSANPLIRKIQLLINGTVVAEFAPAASAPPLAGAASVRAARTAAVAPALRVQNHGQTSASLRWDPPGTSADPSPASSPDPTVTYDVVASGDVGATWHTVAVNVSKKQADVDLSEFPSGSSVQLKVIENAGFTSRTLTQTTYVLASTAQPQAGSAEPTQRTLQGAETASAEIAETDATEAAETDATEQHFGERHFGINEIWYVNFIVRAHTAVFWPNESGNEGDGPMDGRVVLMGWDEIVPHGISIKYQYGDGSISSEWLPSEKYGQYNNPSKRIVALYFWNQSAEDVIVHSWARIDDEAPVLGPTVMQKPSVLGLDGVPHTLNNEDERPD